MMKLFRVHHVHANGLETLALTVSARVSSPLAWT